jgi:hypothetical protein
MHKSVSAKVLQLCSGNGLSVPAVLTLRLFVVCCLLCLQVALCALVGAAQCQGHYQAVQGTAGAAGDTIRAAAISPCDTACCQLSKQPFALALCLLAQHVDACCMGGLVCQ